MNVMKTLRLIGKMGLVLSLSACGMAGGESSQAKKNNLKRPMEVADQQVKPPSGMTEQQDQMAEPPEQAEPESGLSEKPIKKAPEKVKGIYVSFSNVGDDRLNGLIQLLEKTELNAMVIDVKDDLGRIPYDSKVDLVNQVGADRSQNVSDMKKLLSDLKKREIYTIARIVTFKDPNLAKKKPDWAMKRHNGSVWRDPKGVAWVDPYRKEVWDYTISIAKEAVELGFDEIQFDYVRFPDNAKRVKREVAFHNPHGKSKAENITDFLTYANQELKPMGAFISADVFGLVTTARDDMGIGQEWEKIAGQVDYISPMMYPSHYSEGSYGLSSPEANPHQTIEEGLKDALARNKKLEAKGIKTPIIRPWYQDFDFRRRYGTKEVRDQIKAGEELGIHQYLIWNQGNRYTEDAYK
jgi:hypothetical protein